MFWRGQRKKQEQKKAFGVDEQYCTAVTAAVLLLLNDLDHPRSPSALRLWPMRPVPEGAGAHGLAHDP